MSLLSVSVLILLANILDFGAIEKLKDLETCIHIPHPGNTILGLPRFCIVGILCLDACCLVRLKLLRFDSSAQIVKPGKVNEAPRLSVRRILWILASNTVFVRLIQYSQILRRQCCLWQLAKAG